MKNYPWILLTGGLMALAFAPGACGGGGGGNTGGAGGGASTSSSTTTTTTSSHSSSGVTTSTGAGGGTSCAGTGWFDDTCETCMTASCCTEVNDCQGDSDCSGCADGTITDSATCQANAAFVALATCFQGPCNDACVPKSECNPITNEGCTTAGAACDLSGNNIFVCFDPPNDADLCAACSNSAGPFCKPGSHCNEDANGGQCTKYCCDDADCGSGGTCDKTNLPSGVGLCLPGAGSDAGSTLAVCDSPATAPSGGSCYTP